MASKTLETAHLVVLDNDEAMYIDKIQLSGERPQMTLRTGCRVPLYCTAVDKVLLAHLPPADISRIFSTIMLSL